MSAVRIQEPANQNFEINRIEVRISEISALHDYMVSVFDDLYWSYRKSADISVGSLIVQMPTFISIVSEALNELHRSKYVDSR